MEDAGEAIEVGPGGVRVWIALDEDETVGEQRLREGRVEALERTDDGWLAQMRDGEGPARRLLVSLPEGLALPFGTGDTIRAEVVVRLIMPSPTTDGRVLDEAGRVLVASVQSGNPDFLPGLSITPGEVTREIAAPRPTMAKRLERALWVTHEGRALRLAGHGWRRLPLGSGALLAKGHAWDWEPGLPVPPDTDDGWQLSLVRTR